MKKSFVSNYRKFRSIGYTAKNAFSASKTLAQWSKLESAGLAQIIAEPDDCCDMDDLKGDTYNREVNPEIPELRMQREEKAFEEFVGLHGVWGVIGQYRLNEDSNWITGGSIWGIVDIDPTSPFSNEYVTDIMGQTIGELKNSLLNRCQSCRQLVQA
jgi:hypothetical protein